MPDLPRTDPAYAPTVEVFDHLQQREIHQKVQLLDPVALHAGSQAWQGSATGLTDAVAQAHTEIRALIADGWRGGAAGAAADAVRDFEQHGQRLADVFAAVAQRLGQAGDAAEALRAAIGVGEQTEADLSSALLDPTQATAIVASQKAAEHDRQDVVQAMDSIYANVFLGAGTGVPAFPDAPAGIGAPGSSTPAPGIQITTTVDPSGTPVSQPVSNIVSTPQAETPGATEPEQTEEPQPEREPEASTVPAGTTPASVLPTIPGGTDTTPAVAKPVPVTADTSAAAAAPQDRTVRPVAGAPVTAAPAATVPAATMPTTTTTPASADDERKREERRRETNAGDAAVTGMGAGAVGGLMGGAMAAADTTRQGSSVAANASRPARPEEDEDDDDLLWEDDDLTFLEPGEENSELIGELDPTTPPVVGEWTELE